MTALDVALSVARALESCGVDYFLGGSMASSLYGQPRLTNDIDFVVLLRPNQVVALKAALGDDFDVDEVALEDAARRKGSWNIFHAPTVTRIDLFVVRDDDYDAEEFLRRRRMTVLPGEALFVKSAEDTVLRKLLWFKAGGEANSQQLRDVVDVLRVQGARLDDAYLTAWARKLDLVALLARARALAAA